MFRVVGTEEFNNEFEELKKRAKKGDSEGIQLLKMINNGIDKLKYDYRYGDHISKKKIPKEYVKKYGVKNLWKLNLSSFWWMIYTVRGSDIEVISIILEVLDHNEYDKKFGYKTS